MYPINWSFATTAVRLACWGVCVVASLPGLVIQCRQLLPISRFGEEEREKLRYPRIKARFHLYC